MRRSFTTISLLVALAVLFTAVPTAARSKIAIGASDPRRTVEQHMAEVGQYLPGYKPAMWSLWSNWGGRDGTGVNNCIEGRGNCFFPRAEADRLMDMGITPVVWWQPTDDTPNSHKIWSSYPTIASGKHDKYIRQWARNLKAVSQDHNNRPIVVRFAHEATGRWFPWSLQNWNNSAASFKKAWRHIHKQFKAVGAIRHVKFVWSNYLPRKGAYPGDRYVDYVGVTILNFGKQAGKRNRWREMPGLVNRSVKLAKQFSKRPIMLSEVASNYQGGNKAAWIRKGYMKTYRSQPRVQAILYLDTEAVIAQKHPSWRLDLPSNGSALQAYANIAKRRAFKGHIPK